jgi:hypothetical protein
VLAIFASREPLLVLTDDGARAMKRSAWNNHNIYINSAAVIGGLEYFDA